MRLAIQYWYILVVFCVSTAAAQTKASKKPQLLHGEENQHLAYYGVFLGELRNTSYGIESGRAYLVNESHIQVVGMTVKGAKTDLKMRFSFSTNTETGKAEEVYEVKVDRGGEEFLSGRNDNVENMVKARLILKIPKRDYSLWKFFGIVSEAEWKYVAAVPLSNKSAPRPFCCLPALNGWVYNVRSEPIEVLDAQTLRIPKFSFEGLKPPDGWFFAGKGLVEKTAGKKCNVKGRDTKALWCSLKEDIADREMIVQLPDNETVYSVQWFSVYCFDVGVDFGHIEFELNPVLHPVPPVIPPVAAKNSSSSPAGWTVPIVFAVPDKDKPVDLTFTLGPAGGVKAKLNRGACDNLDRVWYIQGELQPHVYVQRGVTYRLKIYGGLENPLYLTTERSGGWSQKPETEKLLIRNLAGEKGDAAGDLCEWKPIDDARASKPDNFADFGEYRHFLSLQCSNTARPSEIKWTPEADAPDEVFYASFTQFNMGGKIFVCNKLEGDALKPKCVQ